jgi:hypothetical protein
VRTRGGRNLVPRKTRQRLRKLLELHVGMFGVAETCERLDISRRTVRHVVELDKCSIGLAVAMALAKSLGISLDWAVYGVTQP